MNIERFEAEMRLGIPFNEKWDTPDANGVRLEMFRKRSKPFTWRPVIDPHIFLFYGSVDLLSVPLKEIRKEETSTRRLKKTSFKAHWYSGSKSGAFLTAREELESPRPRLYPFGLESLFDDIEEFRKSREELRISHGYWAHPAVGATLFIIDWDSFDKEEQEEVYRSGILKHLLFDCGADRIYLMIVAKDARALDSNILEFLRFGCFLGFNKPFVKPFIKSDTYIVRPLVFSDPLGSFYRERGNESGLLYNRKYSLNDIGEEVLAKHKANGQAFVDWIEALDDGTD